MKYLLFVLAVVPALYGGFVWATAGSALHQNISIGMFTIAAVLLSGGAIVDAIENKGGR